MKRLAELTWKSWPLRTAGMVLALMCLALVPLAFTGCGHSEGADAEKPAPLVEVTVTNPLRHDLTREIVQPGYLRPYEVTPIYTKIAGFAEEPNYDIGDYVKKGQLMVSLFVPEEDQKLLVAKARVEQAEADLTQSQEAAVAAKAAREAARADIKAKDAAIDSADAEVQRWYAEVVRGRRLLLEGVYDKQSVDEMVNKFKSAEAMREEAKANDHSAVATFEKIAAYYNKAVADVRVAAAALKVAKSLRDFQKDWLDYAQITAPYDGIVTDRRVHKGHFLQPSNSGSTSKAAEPLFTMMRVDLMRCTVEVPELDALLVRDGDPAKVEFQAMPGSEVWGEVTRNTSALDEHNRTLRVELHLKNPTGATVTYTASASGVITSVQATPASGGSGYPPNTTVPLLITGGKGAMVKATTNGSGQVVRVELTKGGSDYIPGFKAAAYTLSNKMLRPNMYANVTIYAKIPNAWTLPEDAVMNDILANGDRSYCFVVEKGKAQKLFLEVGSHCENGLQILRKQRLGDREWQPLTGNEEVVISNHKALLDGQEVSVVPAQAAH